MIGEGKRPRPSTRGQWAPDVPPPPPPFLRPRVSKLFAFPPCYLSYDTFPTVCDLLAVYSTDRDVGFASFRERGQRIMLWLRSIWQRRSSENRWAATQKVNDAAAAHKRAGKSGVDACEQVAKTIGRVIAALCDTSRKHPRPPCLPGSPQVQIAERMPASASASILIRLRITAAVLAATPLPVPPLGSDPTDSSAELAAPPGVSSRAF